VCLEAPSAAIPDFANETEVNHVRIAGSPEAQRIALCDSQP